MVCLSAVVGPGDPKTKIPSPPGVWVWTFQYPPLIHTFASLLLDAARLLAYLHAHYPGASMSITEQSQDMIEAELQTKCLTDVRPSSVLLALMVTVTGPF